MFEMTGKMYSNGMNYILVYSTNICHQISGHAHAWRDRGLVNREEENKTQHFQPKWKTVPLKVQYIICQDNLSYYSVTFRNEILLVTSVFHKPINLFNHRNTNRDFEFLLLFSFFIIFSQIIRALLQLVKISTLPL